MSAERGTSAPRWKSGAFAHLLVSPLFFLLANCAPETRDLPVFDFGAIQNGASMSREELRSQIQARLDQLKHLRREPSSPGGVDDLTESLAGADEKLSRDDLLNIRRLLIALAAPESAAEIRRLGREDRRDTGTEHGGVLDVDESGRLRLTIVPPMFGGNDLSYVASDRAMELARSHMAMFHFHFAHEDSSEDAGPGVGDLRFAAATRTTCVVFTSLSAASFDVDYYTPSGAVVDLGIYNAGR